jgi:hypothetical protein
MNREERRKKIIDIFDKNQLDDLNRFMKKRQCLNGCNVHMLYLFHLIQSAGILTTSYGASVNDSNYIWTGIALNMVASLIQIYEKINYSQLKKILNDIQAIKDDKYTDESPLVDPDKDLETGHATNATHAQREVSTKNVNNPSTSVHSE